MFWISWLHCIYIFIHVYTVFNPCVLQNKGGDHFTIILSLSRGEIVEVKPCIWVTNMYTINTFEQFFYFTVSWHANQTLISVIISESETCSVIMKVKIKSGLASWHGGEGWWPLCHVMHVTVPFRTKTPFIASLLPPVSLLAPTLCIFELSIKINFQLRHYRWVRFPDATWWF